MTGAVADARPTPYLRLARECPEHRWWRLPVGLIIGLAAYMAAAITFGVIAFVVLSEASLSEDVLAGLGAEELTTTNAAVLGLLLLSVAVWLPAQLVGRQITGPRLGDLMSVEGRLRVRWLATCSLLAFAVYGALIGIAVVLDDDPSPVDVSRNTWAVIAVSLLIVPFQATAEEVVFRGQLMQMVGSWTRWAWVPVVVSTPLFVAGHTYELWGLVDVGIFGLTAAYLTIRTGGLEAAMAAHTANNVVLIVLESAGVFARTTGDYGPVDLLPTLLSSVLISLAIEVAFRRSGLARTRPRLPGPPPKARPMPYPYPAAPAYPYPPPQGQPVAPAPSWMPPPVPAWQPPPAPVPEPVRSTTVYPDYPGEIAEDWGRV